MHRREGGKCQLQLPKASEEERQSKIDLGTMEETEKEMQDVGRGATREDVSRIKRNWHKNTGRAGGENTKEGMVR